MTIDNLGNKSSDVDVNNENYKNDSKSDNKKEFMRYLSQPNELNFSALEPKSTDFEERNYFIGNTKTGAKIYAHTDPKEGGAKATDYLCGHVFRIGTEMKTNYLLIRILQILFLLIIIQSEMEQEIF